MGGAIKSAVSAVTSTVGKVIGADAPSAGSSSASPAAASPTATSPIAATAATPSYAPPPELRGTMQDAQNAMDFQNNASRRRPSGGGAQMLAGNSPALTNAGTKTLLGS